MLNDDLASSLILVDISRMFCTQVIIRQEKWQANHALKELHESLQKISMAFLFRHDLPF